MRPQERVRVFVVWGTVLEDDTDPPSSRVSSLLFDPRVDQFWDPKHGTQAAVATAAAQGVKGLEEFKPGEHTPYDLALVYRPRARWGDRLPAPVYCGSPVAVAMDGITKSLSSIAVGAGAPAR